MKALMRFIVVACFAGNVCAQQPNQPPTLSPEQQKMQFWVGDWTYDGDKFTGTPTGRSILNGFGFESVFNEQSPSGETQSVEVDTYDSVRESYPYISVSSDGSFDQGSFTVRGSVAAWQGTVMVKGKQYKERGTDAVAPDGMSSAKYGEISVEGKTWVPWSYKATEVQVDEKSAVEATVREFELAVQDYNLDKVNSFLTPEARWIEHSLPNNVDVEIQTIEKLKSAGIHIAYRLHDLDAHVQGDVAWVTLNMDGTFSADSAEGQKLLLHPAPDKECMSQGSHVSCEITFVESQVLVKTPGGWKIALGHTSRVLKERK